MATTTWQRRLGFAAIIGLTLSVWCLAQDDKATPAKPKVAAAKITVSKETTWATEPLRDNGTVDYLEAVNRRFSQGVTPENNACVVLYQAMGPRPEGGKGQPDAFFHRLGMKPLPTEGPYYRDLGRWAGEQPNAPKNLQEVIDMQSKSSERPWTKEEFPLIAAWLKDNEAALQTVTLAAERPKYFSPLVGSDAVPDRAMIMVTLPGVQKSREFARALLSRAMWELAEGSQLDAWRDLMTVHRLGRLMGQGPTLIEHLVGVAIESMAMNGEQRFLSETKPSAKLLAIYRRQLDRLPPRASIADSLDACERATFLDCAQRMASGKMKLKEIADGQGKGDASVLEKLAEGAIVQSVDWDVVAMSANKWYDRIVETASKPDYRVRTAEMKQFNDDLKKLTARNRGPSIALALLGGKPAISQAMSDVLVSLLLPAFQQVVASEGRVIQRMRNLELAFALEAWRAEHNSYPDSLEALAPKHIAEVPLDLFTAQPLKYLKKADGYRFYSVGQNEQDEEGRSFDDLPRGDDLMIEMPVPKK